MEAHSPYAALAAALRERRDVIADHAFYQRDPEGHLAELKRTSELITTLQSSLPPPVHPQLVHFFERCSYDKALAFIEELPASAGRG
jgi:hypothetical protein